MQSKLWNVGLCCHLTVHIAETMECSNLISHRVIPLKRCNGKQTTTVEKYQKPTMKIYSVFMTPHLRFMTRALKYKNMTNHNILWIHNSWSSNWIYSYKIGIHIQGLKECALTNFTVAFNYINAYNISEHNRF